MYVLCRPLVAFRLVDTELSNSASALEGYPEAKWLKHAAMQPTGIRNQVQQNGTYAFLLQKI